MGLSVGNGLYSIGAPSRACERGLGRLGSWSPLVGRAWLDGHAGKLVAPSRARVAYGHAGKFVHRQGRVSFASRTDTRCWQPYCRGQSVLRAIRLSTRLWIVPLVGLAWRGGHAGKWGPPSSAVPEDILQVAGVWRRMAFSAASIATSIFFSFVHWSQEPTCAV